MKFRFRAIKDFSCYLKSPRQVEKCFNGEEYSTSNEDLVKTLLAAEEIELIGNDVEDKAKVVAKRPKKEKQVESETVDL